MSSFLMNSGYSGVDPGKFPGSPSESEYSQSSYLGSHSDYYSHMQTAAAAQHYGYGATAAAAAVSHSKRQGKDDHFSLMNDLKGKFQHRMSHVVLRDRMWWFKMFKTFEQKGTNQGTYQKNIMIHKVKETDYWRKKTTEAMPAIVQG